MSRMSPGTDAKKKADRDRYHANPERFKQAARNRYDSDPEVFQERSQRNRLKRTDEQVIKHLGYSRNYYLENAVELRVKKLAHHVASKDQINDRRRYLRLEAKNLELVKELLTPILTMVFYFDLVKAERLKLAQIAEEEARKAKKRAGVTITQNDVDDAVARYLKKGGLIDEIPSNYQAPTTGPVGIKVSRG